MLPTQEHEFSLWSVNQTPHATTKGLHAASSWMMQLRPGVAKERNLVFGSM